MLPPMFLPTPFLGSAHKINDHYSTVSLQRQEKLKNMSASDCSEEVEKKDQSDGAASCNSSVNNSSFDKCNSSFSEEQEPDSGSEEANDSLDVESPKSNQEETKENTKKSNSQVAPSITQYHSAEMFNEHYKHMLPWLLSQWAASGQDLNEFWKRCEEATQKQKPAESPATSPPVSENFHSNQMTSSTKGPEKNCVEGPCVDLIPKPPLKTLKRSQSLPTQSVSRDDVIGESYSDPGKQSPTRSSDDDLFKECPEKSYDHEIQLYPKLEVPSQTNRFPQPISTDSHNCARKNSQVSLPKPCENFTTSLSQESAFDSLSNSKTTDGFSNKEKSGTMPGGEIHGGVWIPTRSRNCHLCGKEFKNVYR